MFLSCFDFPSFSFRKGLAQKLRFFRVAGTRFKFRVQVKSEKERNCNSSRWEVNTFHHLSCLQQSDLLIRPLLDIFFRKHGKVDLVNRGRYFRFISRGWISFSEGFVQYPRRWIYSTNRSKLVWSPALFFTAIII